MFSQCAKNAENKEQQARPPRGISQKPMIGLDMDDVLCHYVPFLLYWHNETHGTSFSMMDMKFHQLTELWGGTHAESERKIHEFSKTTMYKNLPCIKGCFQHLKALQDQFDFVVVTARNATCAHETETWLNKHLPNLIQQVQYCSRHDEHEQNGQPRVATKADICRQLNVTAMIDDSYLNAKHCSVVVKHVALFNHQMKYPWSLHSLSSHETHYRQQSSHLTVVRDWNMIAHWLTSIVSPTLLQAMY